MSTTSPSPSPSPSPSLSDPVNIAKPILDRLRLKGRVALVTGGGQGIGRGYVHALADAGAAAVAVVDINKDTAQSVVNELRSKGYNNAIAIKTDVTKIDEVNDMIETIINKFGTLTIAVNNAGIGDWTAAEEVQEKDWDAMMNINMKGVFLCAQAEARAMMKFGYGKIINTASMSGSIVNVPQKQVVYNTSKAAVIHMTRSLAVEWASHGIRVNCISPGYTKTALLIELLKTPVGKEYSDKWLSLTPLGTFANVTDHQGAVVYLASEASDFMTGNDMIIDGGYSRL